MNINPVAILINGPPGSGKDTLAEILGDKIQKRKTIGERNTIIHDKFAESIASALQSFFHGTVFEDRFFRLLHQRTFKDSLPVLNKGLKQSARKLMISFSEEFAKPTFGYDVFGYLAALRMLEKCQYPDNARKIFIYSDCGFQIEFDAFCDTVWQNPQGNIHTHIVLITLNRPGFDFKNDSREPINQYHQNVLHIPIENDGSLIGLVKKAEAIVGHILSTPPRNKRSGQYDLKDVDHHEH